MFVLRLVGASFLATWVAACASVPGADSAQLNGKRIEFVSQGQGSPTVVFESGMGDGLATWSKVLPEVEKHSRVFAYSRPGYGRSESSQSPRDPFTVARELRVLLRQQNLTPPYVLVGHSLGGLYMQSFAALYPDEVTGLVLVDPTHPRQWQAITQSAPRDAAIISTLSLRFSPAMKREFEAAKTPIEISARPHPGRTVVLAASRPDALVSSSFVAMRRELLLELSRNYGLVQPTTVDSGHYIQRDRPEAVVAAIEQFTRVR
jgi:pimeloyl-ACP methyl ester carboxylesterase